MAGRLVVNPTGGTAIIVESGDYFAKNGTTIPVQCWPTFTGRRVGNEVSVLDLDGSAVATTGRRYRIEWSFEPVGFVACGDDVLEARPTATAGTTPVDSQVRGRSHVDK